MATKRFRGQEIGSYTPALDARIMDRLFVVGGRNYSFDSKGPKTDFGNRMLTPIPLRNTLEVQGTRIAGRAFVHTQDAILEWSTALDTWIPCYYLHEASTDGYENYRWSSAFLDRTIFFSHPAHGIFRVGVSDATLVNTFFKMTSVNVTGLPSTPLGIVESNARLCILTPTAVYWSGPSDGTDFVPTIGGAGFVVLASRIGGEPLAITDFSGGFIVWTTSGALLAEFIGGDNVFRFSVLVGAERPQNPLAVARLNVDQTLFLTNRGLFRSANGQTPEAVQPAFNEFIRDYLTQNPGAQGRLEYDNVRDRLYVLLRVQGSLYKRVFVLIPTLDSWGEFSSDCYGVLPMTGDSFGFVGYDNLARVWDEIPFRQVPSTEPRDLKYPRMLHKQMPVESIVSSPMICQHTEHLNNVSEGYYHPESDAIGALATEGLDAEIEVGYFRPGLIDDSHDGFIEIQSLGLGSYPQRLPTDLVPGNLEYDTYIEHYSKMYSPVEDWESLVDVDEDWESSTADDEEYGGAYALFSPSTYSIELRSSIDGYTYESTIPDRARFDAKATTFSCFTSGVLHTMVLGATDPGDIVQLRYLEMTLAYGGRLL